MGLEAVEFVIALEDAFGVAIPDTVAQELRTPRMVADYIEGRLPQGTSEACHSQRAFHKLRGAVMQVHEVPRAVVTPSTEWRDIMPGPGFRRKWKHLAGVIGARDWPPADILGFNVGSAKTVGATAEYLAIRSPAMVKGENQTWTRSEIERVIASLLRHESGIESFEWDQSFVDLGF